ncbi:MAG: DNA cytosine methyltransferase [Thermodesulfobacteriota bacterium]
MESKHRTFSEFFAGIGLMRLGLERAGWKAVFANDIDADKADMYAAHFGNEDPHFSLEDIHALKPPEVPPALLATASFPCNDLSLAGARKGLGGKQSSAFWGFIRILEGMGHRRPPMVLLENVSGFLTSKKGEDFREALRALNNLGYATDAIIIDAARFVPQSRVRLFVIGVADPIRQPKPAKQAGEDWRFFESDVRPKALADFIFSHPEIHWKIRDLPPLPQRDFFLPDFLEDLPDDSLCWWNDERRDYLLGQMSERHSKIVREMKARRKWSYATAFRRVRKGKSMAEIRVDGVAGCLRTPRGGSGRQILVKAGYGKVSVRLLTPRECARLMGADDFVIETSLNKALFGFGDAVCVPVIEWIGENYLNPLPGEIRWAKERGRLPKTSPSSSDFRRRMSAL